MSDQDNENSISTAVTEKGNAKSMSRRALIKGGVTAMPVVLTLQSGAALAYASAMTISAAHPSSVDDLGRTLCLDTKSVYPTARNKQYDMGNPPKASVNIIPGPPREYHIRKSKKSPKVPARKVCNGGTYWYKEEGKWTEVRLPRKGVVVSSGAMTSVADYIYDTLI